MFAGAHVVAPRHDWAEESPSGLHEPHSAPWIRWDALIYKRIALHGYEVLPNGCSTSVFFPAHPLTLRATTWLTGLPIDLALLIGPNLFFFLGVGLLLAYVRTHSWATLKDERAAVLLFSLWPTSLFFHVGYSESLFVATLLAFLVSLRTKQSDWIVALIAGAAFTIRAVGIALPLVFWASLWPNNSPRRRSRTKVAILVMLSLWGVLAVSLDQWRQTGDSRTFVTSRSPWNLRKTYYPLEHAVALITLEPLWSPYWPNRGAAPHLRYRNCLLCSLYLANPILVGVVITSLVYGKRVGAIDNLELLLAALLVGIPYVTHAYQNFCVSQGRYTLVAVPFMLSAAHALARVRRPVSIAFLGICTVFLLIWSIGFGGSCFVV